MNWEDKLPMALEEYDAAVMASLPEPSDCTHSFSKGFERKMRGLCRRTKHPAAYKALQRAACILLAILALFGSLIAFNADVRATVINWITEYSGRSAHYSYKGEPDPALTERKSYALGWLPEGYEFYEFTTNNRSGQPRRVS